jgi:hypothetical protein
LSSWDLLAGKFPVEMTSPEEAGADLPDILPRATLIHRIQEVVPWADFSDQSRGRIDSVGGTMEVDIGEDDPVSSVMFHVHAGDEAVAAMAAILDHLGLRAIDTETGEFFDPHSAGATPEDWRAYRDHVIAERRESPGDTAPGPGAAGPPQIHMLEMLWEQEPMPLGRFAKAIQGYLCLLAGLHPSFERCVRPTARLRWETLPATDAGLVEHLVANVLFDPDEAYDGLDDRGKPTLETTRSRPLSFFWVPAPTDVSQTRPKVDRETGLPPVWFAVQDGGTDRRQIRGHAIGLQAAFTDGLYPLGLMERVFEATISYWRPGFAVWTDGRLLTKRGFESSIGNPGVGWKTYVGWNPPFRRLPRGVQARVIPPGGILLTLPGGRPDARNRQQLSSGFAVARALRGQKLPWGLSPLLLPSNSLIFGRGLPAEANAPTGQRS